MNFKSWVVTAAAVVALAGCGGGGGAEKSPFGSSTNSGSSGSGSSGSGSGSSSGNGGVTSNSSGTVVLALSSNTISSTTSANVTALVKDAANEPMAGVLVTFGLTGGSANSGQLSPISAITDNLGQAITVLSPSAGTSSGAAYVTASVDLGSTQLVSRQAFTIRASSVTLDSVSMSPSTINGYASSVGTVNVTGANISNPVTVKLSSPCSDIGTAVISPATLTLTTSSGTFTYQDKACGAVDRITAQIVGSAMVQRTDLTVIPPATTGIQFVSVDNANICLTGTGCPSNANVIFKVVDATGAGKSGVRVNFTLDNSISSFADLGSTYGLTGSDGTVAVTVSSKQTPTPLRVTAQVNGTSFQTVSNQLRISGGLPVASMDDAHGGISTAAVKYSLDANTSGDSSDVTVRLVDRFGAPAIDGTAVSFVTDGGTIVPASCLTEDGWCTVKLVVSNPRPTNGRVHLIAYAKGQEYFLDLNSNGIQDGSEVYDDVPMGVCLDRDEDGLCSPSEFIVGVASTPDVGNGMWDGNGAAFARYASLFFFSDTTKTPRLFKVVGSTCTNTALSNADMVVYMGGSSTRQYLQFCVRDGNTAADVYGGNPLISGASVSGVTSVQGITITSTNSPVPGNLTGPTFHVLTFSNTTQPVTYVGSGTGDVVIVNGKTSMYSGLITINPASVLYKVASGACTGTVVDDAYMTVAMGTVTAQQFIDFCVSDEMGNSLRTGATLNATTSVAKIGLSVSNSPATASSTGKTMHRLTVTNLNQPLAPISAGTATLTITDGGRTAFTVNINP